MAARCHTGVTFTFTGATVEKVVPAPSGEGPPVVFVRFDEWPKLQETKRTQAPNVRAHGRCMACAMRVRSVRAVGTLRMYGSCTARRVHVA